MFIFITLLLLQNSPKVAALQFELEWFGTNLDRLAAHFQSAINIRGPFIIAVQLTLIVGRTLEKVCLLGIRHMKEVIKLRICAYRILWSVGHKTDCCDLSLCHLAADVSNHSYVYDVI